MKLIVAGPRDLYPDHEIISGACDRLAHDLGLLPTQIITGGASGVDACVRHYALRHGIPTCEFEANWSKYGRGAGPLRNARMAEEADALLVIKRIGKGTPGTNNMIQEAEKRGIPVYIEEINPWTGRQQ